MGSYFLSWPSNLAKNDEFYEKSSCCDESSQKYDLRWLWPVVSLKFQVVAGIWKKKQILKKPTSRRWMSLKIFIGLIFFGWVIVIFLRK